MGHHGGNHHSSHSHSHHAVHHATHHYHSTVHYTGMHYVGTGRGRADDPLVLFQNPTCWRVVSWAILVAVCVGIALIISFAVSVDQQSVGMLVGGAVLLMYSFMLCMVTSIKCCVLGSIRYIMCPCLMSQLELDALKNRCQMTHDARYGVVQQINPDGGILNQVQVFPYQQNVLQNGVQNVQVTQIDVQNGVGSNVSVQNIEVGGNVQMGGQVQNQYKPADLVIAAVM
ncbi:Hypothetical_protein [Hexamita inflata]|uniref:Hypothetical_protein n=1 Tax=Hexamita inflata TaxID=28002 RepID=A0AA86R9N0_9EUKA|nr:Hypothetical protein HINF_LOCUS61611 [Hexamita inflata]